MEEVAVLRQFVEQHQIVIMAHKDAILTVKVDKVVPNSRVAPVAHHGQAHLQVARQVL